MTTVLALALTIASSLPDPNAPAMKWVQYAFWGVGVVLAAIGFIFAYRISRYNHDKESAERSARLNMEEVAAMKRRMDGQADDMKHLTEKNTALQHESLELKARTDITAVLKMMQDLMKQSLEHDTAVSKMLAGAIDRGQGQYAEVMDTLKKTLDYLAQSARDTGEQSKENFRAMTAVGEAVHRIAEHLSRVDVKISDVQAAVAPDEPEPKRRR